MKDPAKKQQLLSSFDMPCQVCKEPSKSQCPSCRTPYCSKACQRVDWKRGHKKDCKEMTAEFKRGYNYVEPTVLSALALKVLLAVVSWSSTTAIQSLVVPTAAAWSTPSRRGLPDEHVDADAVATKPPTESTPDTQQRFCD